MLLHHRFIDSAKRYGTKPAIIDRTTDTRLTYRRALIASLILQRLLKKKKSETVGIMLPTGAGSFLAVAACTMAGKTPVLINYSTHAEHNCAYAQHTCDFDIILTARKLCDKVGCPVLPSMVFLEDILQRMSLTDKCYGAVHATLPAAVLKKLLYRAHGDSTAVILFTSGSEKEPKAVMLSHRNIVSNIEGIIHCFDLSERNTLMCVLPVFHVFGFTVNLWLPLTTGMTAVTYANPLDYKTIPGIIRTEQPDVMAATPAFFAGYLRNAQKGDFASLRIPVAGADKVPHWVRDEYKRVHDVTIYEGYGTTETSPVVSTNTPRFNRPGSIGKPLPDVQVKITDLDTSQKCGANTEGKILVKGDLVMKGYFNNIEDTSLRIHDGWYDTGDMGIRDTDGYLWHRGRLRRFVKIGGEMVSLPNVEAAVDRLVDEDVDCCVVGIPDRIKGVKLVLATTGRLDHKELTRKLRAELPPIAIPKTVEHFDELPRMGSGKMDFRTIEAMVEERLTAA
jgi:acyl-[acyl-carrier-protein]-phospholipid O-acyltransferase/long-chain-fatty-acid--[acyl-carrier-protein] ligase